MFLLIVLIFEGGILMKDNYMHEEQLYLRNVIQLVEKQIEDLENKLFNRENTIVESIKNFMKEDDADANQTSKDIDDQEKIIHFSKELHKKKEKTLQSPYFGRIDFIADRSITKERLYIGIQSVIDDNGENILVYDWRAPISSMYYDFYEGTSSYEAIDAVIKGQITLRRQYRIENGELINVYDENMHMNDHHLLEHMLSQQTKGRMKSIVTTIQREQNQIIRADNHPYLIVQGVAGSGKTSAALQRIAYLMYKHRKIINEENFILFTPNPMFSDYISTVLPELGEKNIKQITLHEYLNEFIDPIFTVEKMSNQLEYFYSKQDSDEYKIKASSARLKTSVEFLRILQTYIAQLQTEGIIFNDIKINNRLIISKEKISNVFYTKYIGSLYNRSVGVMNWIMEELELHEMKLKDAAFERLNKIRSYIGEDDELRQRSVKFARKLLEPLKESVERFDFINHVQLYKRLYSDERLFESLCHDKQLLQDWYLIRDWTMNKLDHYELPYEDIAPFLLLTTNLTDSIKNKKIKFIIIDESQDYSLLHFALIKFIFENSRITILGDIQQAINIHSSCTEHEQLLDLLGREQTNLITLTKSYRSTKQIIKFTSSILGGKQIIEAFSRNAEKPKVLLIKDCFENNMIKILHNLQVKGAKSIALIGKNLKECKYIFNELNKLLEIQLIDSDSSSIPPGLIVLPTYWAKGLEFDAVIVFADKENYCIEDERKILYTACTRALHDLYVIYRNEITPFIKEIDPLLYISNDQFLSDVVVSC
jgi:DNA helicase-2/ATP-dependent DNA helicase PcrA